MLNIYICEDNLEQLNRLSKTIQNIIFIEDYDLCFVCRTQNPHTLLTEVKLHSGTGLYFLDIDLNTDMNGFALAQEIRKLDPRGFIVFITTHSELSYMTFIYKTEAMDFILKDNPKELHSRLHQCIIDAYMRYTSENNTVQQIFTIKSLDKNFSVALNDILFFETSTNVHKVILHTTMRTIEFPAKLKNVELQLDERFLRCHRSYLVNKEHIKEIDLKKRLIIMSNNESCLVSSKMLKHLLS